jgi:hypothetical protein
MVPSFSQFGTLHQGSQTFVQSSLRLIDFNSLRLMDFCSETDVHEPDPLNFRLESNKAEEERRRRWIRDSKVPVHTNQDALVGLGTGC